VKRSLAVVAAVALALVGCPEPSQGPCAKVTCAGGEVCDEASGACVPSGEGGGAGGAGGEGGGSAGPDAGPGPDAFCEDLAGARCARELACGRLGVAQLGACLDFERAVCGGLARRADAGVRSFQPTEAAACLAELGAAPCWLTGARPLVCADVFAPASPPGGPCETSDDCRDSHCSGAGSAGCARCVAFGDAGEPCGAARPCAAGLGCPPGFADGGATGGGPRLCRTIGAPAAPGALCGALDPCDGALGECRTPTDGGPARCEALPTVGEPCDEGCRAAYCNPSPADGGGATCEPLMPAGAPCTRAAQCVDLFCNRSDLLDGGARTCGAVALAQPCAAVTDCGPSGYCRGLRLPDDGGFTPGVCAERVLAGAPCASEQLDDGCAAAGASCLDGRCRRPAFDLDAGAECAGPGQCLAALYCPDAGHPIVKATCAPRVGAAERCLRADWCADGLACDLTSQRCGALAAEGEACASRECTAFLACVLDPVDAGSACASLRAPGAGCGASGQCALGAFCATDAGVCRATLAGSQPCNGNHECESGACAGADGGSVGSCVAACFP
jgi:hypothetical protein